jgi:hypothetical protein
VQEPLGPTSEESDIKFVAIVRDSLGRICLDEETLLNPERLAQIVEALNGSNTPNRSA